MTYSIFQKELLVDLTDYRCPVCAGFDFEASEFIPILSEEQLQGHILIECQDCGWNWDTGYFFSEQQYGELVERKYTEWESVR